MSDCMQTDRVIDCATAPIFAREPTDTVHFDDCGSARSEQANAASSKGAVRLSFLLRQPPKPAQVSRSYRGRPG